MDSDLVLNIAADLGCLLMSSGAEIYRVEESMRRVLNAYRLDTAEVFAIPNCIIVSVTTPEGRPETRLRRIAAHGTDVELLERCNQLCRRLCAQTPPPGEALRLLAEVKTDLPRYTPKQILLGYAIAPAFFAPLFGGGVRDALCALISGLAAGVCVLFGRRMLGSNAFFRTAVSAAAVSLTALLLVQTGLGRHVDTVTISALMMLVPGMALTNAMREFMAGDTISGLSRMAEVILTAGAIALGAAAGLYIGHLAA